MRRALATLLMLGSAAGCGLHDRSETMGIGTLPDAAPPTIDAGAGADAAELPDAGSLPDAGGGPDIGVDAGDCAPGCVSSECATAACVGGACVETPVIDGTTCGEMGERLCVAGVCVVRGCGDGYRERGPDPLREGCDDGSAIDGAACSPMCVPLPFVIDADPVIDMEDFDAVTTQSAPAIAVDGRGELLAVWSRWWPDRSSVHARRYTRGGIELPMPATEPIEIDPSTGAPPWGDPTVAGLASGGWVVVWSNDRAGSRDVLFRIVAPDGTLGREHVANEARFGLQVNARVAATASGFVIVWTDWTGRVDDPRRGIRARRFSDSGAALGDELVVASMTAGDQDLPAVAADGDDFIVAWTHADSAPPTLVFARRFDEAGALDPEQIVVSPEAGHSPSVAALGAGSYVVAWESRSGAGDVTARTLAPSSGDGVVADHVAIATRTDVGEGHPAIAALSGSDFLLAWEEDSPPRVAIAARPGAFLAPESEALGAYLMAFSDSGVSAARGSDGVWLVWTGFAPGYEAGAVVQGFHLPVD